jgi:hypothetical protein
MPATRTSPLSYLFTLFARGLFNVLAKASLLPPLLTPAIAALLTRRMFRIRNRFQALLDRFLAGTLPPPRAPRAAAPPRPQAKPRPAPPIELSPGYIAAMLSRIPEASWTCRGFLRQIIDNEQDTKELVAASPAAASYLRTFCRMTGRPPPPWLALPRKRRVRKPRPPAPKKPPDAWKFGRRKYANTIAPECADGPSGSRPPNSIGYARMRPFPRDYRPSTKKDD